MNFLTKRYFLIHIFLRLKRPSEATLMNSSGSIDPLVLIKIVKTEVYWGGIKKETHNEIGIKAEILLMKK